MSLIDIRPALRALLLANSELSTVVGGERIYPGQMPQGERSSSIVYSEVSDVGDYTLDGPTGLARPRYQVTAWAKTADAAAALGLLIKQVLDGYRGTVSFGAHSPQDTVVVRGVFMDASRDLYDDAAKLHGKARDFIIWFAER